MSTITEATIGEEYRQGVTNDGRKVLVHSLRRGPSVGGFVCEYEDGTMDELVHKDFRFIDGEQFFGALCWDKPMRTTAMPASWNGWRPMSLRCRTCVNYAFAAGIPICHCMSRTVKRGAHGDECASYRNAGESCE